MLAECAVISYGQAALLPVLHACRAVAAGSDGGCLVGGRGVAVEVAGIVLGLAVCTQGVAVE